MLLTLSSVPDTRHRLPLAEALSHFRALQSNDVWAALVDHNGQQIETIGSGINFEALGVLGNGLLSMSDRLLRQMGGPEADYVVVNSAERQIVVFPASSGGGAALVIVAPRQMPLGPLLWAARRCCSELGETA